MRRIFVVLLTIASSGACVNLQKPEKVATCVGLGSCADKASMDSGVDTENKPDTGQISRNDGVTASPDLFPSDPAAMPDLPTPDLEPPPVLRDAPPDTPDVTGNVSPDLPPDLGPSARLDTPPEAPDVMGNPTPDLPLDLPQDLGPSTRDVPRDVAVGICAPAGVLQPAGTVCRAAVGPCDIDDTCDGVHANCPADTLAAAGLVCRAVAGDCDIAETCSGVSASCPADGSKQAGTVCRAAAGVCDVAESCTGTSPACPVDSLAPATTVCRPSTDNNNCDPAEKCTGSITSCPTDILLTAPVVPSGVAALAGTLQTTVSWSPASNATGYNVKRSTVSGSGYTTLVSSPTTSASPYLDTGLTGGVAYYYVVSSMNTITTCESANSTQVTATPLGLCTPPAAAVVTATPGNGIVTLSWVAVTGAVSYSVARSQTSGTGYSTVGTVSSGTVFTDSSVSNGGTYFYVVTASNGSCSSGNSNEASASPACTPPAAPAGLTPTAGNGSVTLNWSPSAGASSYSIYRNTDGSGNHVFVNSTAQTTFTDSNVSNGTPYYYVVRASNGSCLSGDSTQVSVTPACVPPSAPTALVATPGDGQSALSWTAPPGALLYRVARNTTGTGTFTPIATPTATNYLDSPLVNGTNYYYVVAASNGSCWSADSAVALATPVCTPPSVPGTLTATAGNGQVTLSWTASTPAPISYTVQRKTGAGGTYATIASPTVNGYSDMGLANDTTYFYRVSAFNGSCGSGYNSEASATPVGNCTQTAPGSPNASPSGSVQVTVTWTGATPTPTTYDIGRSTTSGSGFVSIGSVAGAILTYTDADTNLLNGTLYYYRITAVGSSCTAVSAEASAAPTCSAPGVPSPSAQTNANGSITTSWSTVAGASAYTVYRSTSLGGTYLAISSNQTAATYTDPSAGLANGSTYYYAVSASNANHQCASAQSAPASAMSCAPATVPVGLSKTVGTPGQVRLNWTASTGATQYTILRGTTSGGEVAVATSATNSYTDTGLTNGATYYYKVSAQNGTGNACTSATSSEISASPNACTLLASGAVNYTPNPQTTGAYCFITCYDIAGFGTSNFDGRSLAINGVTKNCPINGNCNTTLPAKDYSTYATTGAYTFSVGAGTYAWAANNWWGTAHNCQ